MCRLYTLLPLALDLNLDDKSSLLFKQKQKSAKAACPKPQQGKHSLGVMNACDVPSQK